MKKSNDPTFRISLFAALGGLLFGYDTAVISGAIGFLQTHFSLSATGVGWAASCALVGCVPGALSAGWLNYWLGRRATLIISATLFLISAIGTAVPTELTTFVIFRILGGVGVGIAFFSSPLYIAEIILSAMRGTRVTLNQFAIITGMLVVYFVNYLIALQGSEEWNTTTGWRWMFGSEAIPALLFLIGLIFVPESPRWLALKGKEERLTNTLNLIYRDATHAEKVKAEIVASLNEKSLKLSAFLKSPWSKVLLFGVALAILQQASGINVFLYYGPEIFKQLGASTDTALLQTIIIGATNMGFTIVALKLVDRVGRRPLLIIGVSGMAVSLVGMGFVTYLNWGGLWPLFCMLVYIACFASSMGPVMWVVLSEIFPNKLRSQAVAIATFFLWMANYAVSQTFPMLNGNKWLNDLFNHAFPFWFYAIMCMIAVVLVYGFLPETKGKTLEEIERYWEQSKK